MSKKQTGQITDAALKQKRTKTKVKKSASLKPTVFNGLNPDLPKNLKSIHSVVDEKGHNTGHLLVMAADRYGNDVAVSLEVKELALGRCDGLAHYAVKAGFTEHLSPKGLRTLAAHLLAYEGQPAFVARRPGYHCVTIKGQRYGFLVLNEVVYPLGERPPVVVAVVIESGASLEPSGTLADWDAAIGVHLSANPYMLISVLAALASALARAFGLNAPILAIVAPSSVGKTTIQQVGRSIRERADKIDDASGTVNGLRIMIELNPDAPVFLQDVHKFDDLSGLMGLLFLAANGGQRLTSTANQKLQAGAELACGLSLSMEMSFMELVGNTRITLPEGFSARCFEMVLQGPHGAFHKLPKGVSAHDFANQLKRACGEHHGAVWAAWIPAIAKNAEKLREWLPETIREAEATLLEGQHVKDRVTMRLVSGLAVWLAVGKLAINLKVLKLKDADVENAVRLIFLEHLGRQAHRTTPIGEKVITTVRDFIDRNANRFPALALFGRNDQNNVPGYTKGTGRELVYLFLLGELEKLLGEKFGLAMALQKLDEAGFLVKNGEGMQVQMRLSNGFRKRFYGIRSSIRFDGDAEIIEMETK